ncbi:polysaccharide biosynthesis/export family protein [Sporomusa acidovorans]|uniref:Polysialic acid transport protein KpsD n=1 Tax=Sporomusa acidovorans (strain ATCC 49682 / DSM 3132 / Mol) TaxID=1123286 RepID=A0ABZ3J7R8_SPOA4|nr:polysaccharide biosynthesis/export family protein [Sporomusa acidovorans]OZC19332.1 polysialic acid transport protein KpsD precursor [Sporomusa acidovorans DSM 3132]SDD80498.1 polysaccharide export outer membrane protein [Sporomusa acidovorans]
MKTKSGVLILVLLFFIVFSVFPVYAQYYQLAPGDVLEISVWGYEELQIKEVPIRPDGRISFPLVGEVQAAGLSPVALNQIITQRLRNFVKDPIVTINILKLRTTRVYVLGEVAKPGMYELEKQHNLLDAIGIAGSYTKYAAKKKVFVIRKDQTGKPLKVNLLQLLEKGDMSQNVELADGDVVFLSDNGRIDFAKDILPWVSATYQIHEMQDDN